MVHSFKLIASDNSDWCAVAAVLTCCTQTYFMILVGKTASGIRRISLQQTKASWDVPVLMCLPLFVYLCEPHELVDVLGQIYHITVWCYHGDEALQRLQVQTVHLSVLVTIAAAATAWREITRWITQIVSVCVYYSVLSLWMCVKSVWVCLRVFSSLAQDQNKPVKLLPEAPQPQSCQHPAKLSFIKEALLSNITHMMGFPADANGFQYSRC